ncbi:MAG: SWIM zinc finger family protein [Cryomorphaceae bacterium]|nr:SWIM zinc finger family protein [Cryomorphaceae bacterium]
MSIPLNAFEQHIDSTILSRGQTYFKQGRVSEPELIKANHMEFVVEGSDEYRVTILFDNEEIKQHDCTCPYDGVVCKHVVACIFYMQKDELGMEAPKQKTRTKKTGKPSVEEQAKIILEKLSHEDLMQFTEEFVLSNESFRDYFLTTFAHLNPHLTLADYKKVVRTEIRSHRSGRYRFISQREAGALRIKISKILGLGEQHIVNGRFESAFFIGAAVLEEMFIAFEYTDDGGGDIGMCLDEAVGLLKSLADNLEESHPVRKKLYKYTIKTYENQLFEGWDWHDEMLEIAQRSAASAKEIKEVLTLIDFEIKVCLENEYRKYSINRLELSKYHLILRIEGKDKALEFARENPHNVKLREELIRVALDVKEFQKAINIAKEGFDIAKGNPNYERIWQYWLLVLYIEIQSAEDVITLARKLFLSDYTDNYDYLKILKRYVETKQWPTFIEELIKDLTENGRNSDLLRRIYVFEERWQELLEDLILEPSLHEIKECEKYLANDYAEALIDLYYHEIKDYLFYGYHTGRKYYKHACQYMKRMNKLGGRPKVEQLKSELTAHFPRRPALLEELAKV